MGQAVIPAVVAVMIAALTWQGHRRAMARGERQTQGYYQGRGLAWGLAAGLALDALLVTLTGNNLLAVAVGVPVGLAAGALVGLFWERRHAGELRPLNAEDLEMRRFALVLGLGAIVLGVLAVLGIVLLAR